MHTNIIKYVLDENYCGHSCLAANIFNYSLVLSDFFYLDQEMYTVFFLKYSSILVVCSFPLAQQTCFHRRIFGCRKEKWSADCAVYAMTVNIKSKLQFNKSK